MTHKLVCSVGTIEFACLTAGNTIEGTILMSAYFQHMGGQPLPYGLNLMLDKRKRLLQCGGMMFPSVYLINGTIKKIPPFKTIEGEQIIDGNLEVDCGVPLLLIQRNKPVWRGIRSAQVGDWIGALGNLQFAPSELYDWEPKISLRPIEAFLIDFRPGFSSFSSLISWSFGQELPYDPDVLDFPSLFVHFELVS